MLYYPPMLKLVLVCLLACCLIMGEVWRWAKKIKNAGVVDIFWYFNFPIIASLTLFMAQGWFPRKALICGMVFVAGMRLGIRLLIRITRHLNEEEGRYRQLRKEWGPRPDRKFFWFFQARALSNVFLCIPFFIISNNTDPVLSAWEYAGAVLWLIAVTGEAVADRQLAVFKKDPRLPNHFFEWLTWMAYFVFALGSPYGVLAILSPAAILVWYILFKRAGIRFRKAGAPGNG